MSRLNYLHRKQRSFKNQNSLILHRILNRNRQLTNTEKLEIMLPTRMAFESLRQGQYGQEDVFSLYCSIRISLSFIQTMNNLDLIEQCNSARKSLAEIYQHWHENNIPRAVTANEQESILIGIEIFESIVNRVTPDELAQLLATTYQKMEIINSRAPNMG